MLFHTTILAREHVTDDNLKAFKWVNQNTPASSRFLVITGFFDLFRDWTSEWFPASAGRISLTTIQGREWSDGDNFQSLIQGIQQIQNCANSYTTVECIEDTTKSLHMVYDFIYMALSPANIPGGGNPKAIQLVVDLKNNSKYELIYETAAVDIFRYHSSP